MSVALHHVVDGPPDAPVLLLGNSLGTDTTMWDDVVPLLARDVRVVRFDHRGQGASPEPPAPYEIADLGGDVVALLDTLGVARASYCGVSLGGMVGLWLAAHAPERIDRLVVACSSAHPGNLEAWRGRADTIRAARSIEPVADPIVSRWLTPGFAAEHPEALARLRAMLVASPVDGYVACCGLLERLDLRPDLARIETPTLVLGGALDASLPAPEHSAPIAAGVAGARYELLDAAHIPMAEQPAAVAQLVLDHLEAPVA